MFSYRFQFMLDRIHSLIQSAEREHRSIGLLIQETTKRIETSEMISRQLSDSLNNLNSQGIDGIASSQQPQKQRMIHQIGRAGFQQKIEMIRNELSNLISYLAELSHQRDRLRMQIDSLNRKKSQFECNREMMKEQYVREESSSTARLMDESAEIVWQIKRSNLHNEDQT